ncbi:S1 RNA-binding domain-containing protein [Nonomuraea candida]|uniref:S1 RNA-binding domain-containing protein n=1 Tax=Nonomuraea candida TaxID=359159 RepID=UPI000694B71E|nr:S1 RNA-binding domain-containing protein [Nonomuraea candida]
MVDEGDPEDVVEILRSFEPGQVRRGVVSSIEPFGVFVDLGGADGMVNMAELSWRRFDDPAEVVEVGQEIVVMVLDVDLERARMSLSLKALQDDPLVELARTRLGSVLRAPVTKVIPFGVFVGIGDGIEGLVHISEFPDGELPSEGHELPVRIADINMRRHRVRLELA